MLKNDDYEMEQLMCFQCKEWISIVQPWTTRPRGVWPSTDVFNNITQYGVLFVPVGCKTSPYEHIEWRISFSIAEKDLIHSFTHVQFVCYATLKTVVSDVVKKLHGEVLCSYFIKTIMFWISEEIELERWREQYIAQYYLVCLKRLIYCVEYRICLHYFIPEINFFDDRFTDNERVDVVRTLLDIYKKGWVGLLQTDTFLEFTMQYNLDSMITSSVVAPVYWLDIVSYKTTNTYPEYWRVLEKIFYYRKALLVPCLTKACNKAPTEQVLVRDTCNKYLYYQYKLYFPILLIGTQYDCFRLVLHCGVFLINLDNTTGVSILLMNVSINVHQIKYC